MRAHRLLRYARKFLGRRKLRRSVTPPRPLTAVETMRRPHLAEVGLTRGWLRISPAVSSLLTIDCTTCPWHVRVELEERFGTPRSPRSY